MGVGQKRDETFISAFPHTKGYMAAQDASGSKERQRGNTQHPLLCVAKHSDRPWARIVGPPCTLTCRTPTLSAAARVEMSVGWGRAEWLSGLSVVFMIPMKDRGSLVHSFSR